MQEAYEPRIDDELLCKLVFKCVEAGDLSTARRFSTVIQKPEFAQCRHCLAPLVPGITSKASTRPRRRLVLSCQSCSSSSGAELVLDPPGKEEKNLRKRRRGDTANAEPMSVKTPSASNKPATTNVRNTNAMEGRSKPVSTEKIKDIQVRQVKTEVKKPMTLLELAEQRKKEEKKRRKSEGQTSSSSSQEQSKPNAPAASPASVKSSLGNIAKLLHSQ